MSIKDLQKRNMIEKYEVMPQEIKAILDAARSDINTAQNLLNIDVCWAFNIAYNAILQTAIALMYAKGFRPTGEAKHVSVILFLREILGKEYEDSLNRFNQMRRRRNKAIYGILRDITEYEAKNTVRFAISFAEEIRKFIEY